MPPVAEVWSAATWRRFFEAGPVPPVLSQRDNLVFRKIFFKAQVDAGLKELDDGQGIPHEEVEKRMSKWFAR